MCDSEVWRKGSTLSSGKEERAKGGGKGGKVEGSVANIRKQVRRGKIRDILACSGGTADTKTDLNVGLSPAPRARTPNAWEASV